MRYTVTQYARALADAVADTAPKDQDKIIANFIAILKDTGDLPYYEAIITEYERLDRETRGVREVEVSLAREGEMNKSLLKQLNELVGNDIEVKQKVDASLIGGVMIKVEDTLIDGSVKGQLSKLKSKLNST